MRKTFLGLGLVLLVLTMFVGYASATPTITIDAPNTALSSYTGPYASVDISVTSTNHATVTFTGLTYGSGSTGYTYMLGGNGAADLNVNSSAFTVSGLSGTFYTGFSASGALTVNSGKNADGFGKFNLNINAFDGYTDAYQTISFTLTNNSIGTTWNNPSDVFTNNSTGYNAAAHIFVGDGIPPSASQSALITGYAGNGTTPPPEVPEPSTLLLMGIGLMGFGLIWIRRKEA